MSTVEDDEQDLTRKQRREQARAERKALEEAEAAGAARRTRLIRLGAVAGVVVVVIVAILIATGGSSSKTAVPKTGKETETVSKQVSAELNGIPQNGATLGNPNAPVTLRYYGDLQCPICRDFTLGALPSIIQNYVRTGKLKIEYLSLETATRRTGNLPDPAGRPRLPRARRKKPGTTSSSSTTSRAKRIPTT